MSERLLCPILMQATCGDVPETCRGDGCAWWLPESEIIVRSGKRMTVRGGCAMFLIGGAMQQRIVEAMV